MEQWAASGHAGAPAAAAVGAQPKSALERMLGLTELAA